MIVAVAVAVECNIDNDDLIIAIDSTGIKITNRGQWMTDKWDTQNKSKKQEERLSKDTCSC